MIKILQKLACSSSQSSSKKQDQVQTSSLGSGECLLYHNTELKKHYELQGVLGVPGTFGEVRSCTHRQSKNSYAVKILRNVPCLEKVIANECEISQRLSHPNCISSSAIFYTKKRVCIVMPACTGGDLFDRVVDCGGVLPEKEVVGILRELLEAVEHLHAQGIVHCDIKLSNIMFSEEGSGSNTNTNANVNVNANTHTKNSNKNSNSNSNTNQSISPNSTTMNNTSTRTSSKLTLKLIDYGVSQFILGDQLLHKEVGSPSFIAPEVLMGSYTQLCDLWSIGVVAFILLCGFNPFNPRALPALRFRHRICQHVLKGFTPEERSGYGAFFPKSRGLGQEARDFIAHLLTADWKSRMTASEALLHSFIVGTGNSNSTSNN